MNKIMNSLFLISIIFLSVPAGGYESNDCEKIAKDFQRIHYGSLVLIQPLRDNGAYDLGAYNGHWINRYWTKETGRIFYDVESGMSFQTANEVSEWYTTGTGKKVEIFDMDKGHPPFNLIWHF